MKRAKVAMRLLATLVSIIIVVLVLLTFSSATVLAAATISLSPASSSPGTTVAVTGTGFGASESITIAFDSSTVVTATATSAGALSSSFIVPASASGPHTVTASGLVTTTPASATFTTTAALSWSKTSGSPGSSITITGAGFGAYESITVAFEGSSVATGTATSVGAWSSSFIVPASASGSHTMTVSGSVTGVVSATFTTTAAISLSKTSGTQGNSVTVTGSGFSASETGITVTFDGNTVASGISANATGAWNSNFTVPASSAGSHTIGAYGSVTTTIPTATFITSAAITLSKTSGSPGSSVTITGSGFSANETGINVTFDGNMVATGISASATGAWNSNFTVPASTSGSHNVGAYGSVTTSGTAPNVTFTIGAGITLSKTSGSPGSSVTITGSGFSANETGINVTVDGNPITSGISASNIGGWSSTFVIPSLASGSHSIGAYGSISIASSIPSVSFMMGAAISLSKVNGSPGNSITVTGSGFGANETGISITFDGNPITSGISANSSGTWTANLIIPPSVFGSHTISASGSMTQASTANQSGFNIAASVVLSPTTGYVGSTIRISGSGFAANSQLRITYDDVEIALQSATTDTNGNVSQSITIPISKAGSHSIAVIDMQGNNVKTSFTISNTPPPVPTETSPKDNSTLSITGNITPTFRWTSVTDPNGVSYELQIDTNPDFSDPVLDKLAIQASHYTLSSSEALLRGKYYWRVKAINNASNESPWSEPWTLKSGLMAPWMLALIIVLGVAAIGAGVYFGLVRTVLRKREAITVSEVEMPTIVPGQWQALESPEESPKERQAPKKLALPEVSRSSKTLSTEDQARIKVIVEFAQSIPLADPDYNVKWLVNLVESQTQTQISVPVYEQLIKGELQLHYEPSWTRHPIYKDLTNLLQKQPILQKLDTFIGDVERCASEAMALIQQINRESASEIPPDFLTRGGWGFLAAVYTDAINWYAGKSLHDPAERDYVLENANGGKESAQRWLSGEATTLFAGRLILAQDEKEALELRAVHLKLRRTWRNSEKARQASSAITQLQLKRNELLNAFSQFGRAK